MPLFVSDSLLSSPLSIYLSESQHTYLPASLPVCINAHLNNCVSIFVSDYLSNYSSVCLHLCPGIYVLASLPVCFIPSSLPVSLLASLTLLICLFASPPPPLEFSDDMHIYFCDTLLSSSNPACPSACLNICLAAVIPLCKSDNLPVCLSAYQPVCIYACFLP